MMRILVLSNLYPPNVVGGYERLCFEVTSALATMGHSMTVLTSRYGGKVADYPGQRVLREWDLLVGADIYAPYPGTDAERDAVNRVNLHTLHRVMEETKPDVVFAWNLFFLDANLLHALEEAPVRVVVMLTDNWLLVMRNPHFVRDFFRDVVHGAVPWVPPPQLSLIEWARRAMRRRPGLKPTGLEAIFGAAFMRDLYAVSGSTFDRQRVIHNGVRQSEYMSVPAVDRTRLVRPSTLQLLFAGRLVDLKGAHTAIDALSLLDPAAMGVDRVQLTLVGDAQDAAYMARLREAIAASSQAEMIHVQPAVSEGELPTLFAAHDIYLFPSLYEPFSLTLIHALALGIPTVASDVGGNVEIVRDRKSGLIFGKNDPARLANCVEVLARNGRLRARLARGGRQAASRFTFERMVGEMAAFLSHP